MMKRVPSRLAALVLVAALMSGCERPGDLEEPPVDLGPFLLGHNIVVADNAQKVPISRDVTEAEWETAMKKAVADRFGRYKGDRFYDIGINIDGYAVAPPGIPLVAAPKSVLVITANVWDDARRQRLSGPGKQFYVFESLSGETMIGTGLTRSKQEQLDALAYNAAKVVEEWFLENPQWFGPGIPVPDPYEVGAKAAPAIPPGLDPAAVATAVPTTESASPRPSAPAAPVPANAAPIAAPITAPNTSATGAPTTAPTTPANLPSTGPDSSVVPSLPGGAIYPQTP